ncbi:HAD-IIB family hydrolase [Anaerofustis sp. LCP19S3_F7]|uniref:HAD-IIB family hydrolase n=1 Tax=Anaerofustis sp. LCP19S3_F7 TaxID=3440247 RepID=UPI003F8F9F5F
MVKLLILDLDKTLLRDDGTISKEDKNAIQLCKEKGIKISIISGRNEESMTDIVRELDLFENVHIGVNGAILIDYKKGIKELATIDNDIYAFLVNQFNKENRAFMPLNKDGYFYDKKGPLYDDVTTWIKEESLKKGNLYNLKNCYRISVRFEDKKDLEHLKSYLPDLMYGTVDRNVYDIRPTKVNKFMGLMELMKYYDVTKDEIATIGDQGSDIELLKNTKYSFAVKNASKDAKEAAKFILNRTNNENAVSEMINMLIKPPT